MTDQPSKINFDRLKLALVIALADGALVFGTVLFALGQLPPDDLVAIVMAFGFAAICYAATFYLLSLVFAPGLTDFIKEDRTVIKGGTVEMVTDVEQSEDPRLNGWISTFTFARSMFALGIIPVIILAGLYFFG